MRRAGSEALERGRLESPPARLLARIWGRLARPERPLHLPDSTAVIGVAGATLGGSYATPTVLALAGQLAGTARRVAVVGHAYGARPPRAMRVSPDARLRQVGDEALWLARSLEGRNVPVYVAPDRQSALDAAAADAGVVLVDSLLQARPRRLRHALLVVDANAPWGAGRCPPAGDLRAPLPRLLDAADSILVIAGPGTEDPHEVAGWLGAMGKPAVVGESRLLGAKGPFGRVPLGDLAGLRLGLLLAVARAHRVLDALAAVGLEPAVVWRVADHADFRRSPWDYRFPVGSKSPDLWLTTAKCRTKLGPVHRGAPVLELEHEISLPPALELRVGSSASASTAGQPARGSEGAARA